MNLELNVVRFENEDVIATSSHLDYPHINVYGYNANPGDPQGPSADGDVYMYCYECEKFIKVQENHQYLGAAAEVITGNGMYCMSDNPGLCTEGEHDLQSTKCEHFQNFQY